MAMTANNIITKVNGNNKVIDFRDFLVPSGEENYAMLHGIGGKKYACNSTIRVTICDFSKGKGDNSVTVYASLSPETVELLYNVAKAAAVPSNADTDITITDARLKSAQSARDQLSAIYRIVNQAKKSGSSVNADDLLKRLKGAGQAAASVLDSAKTEKQSYGPKYTYSSDKVIPYTEDKNGMAVFRRISISRNGVRSDGTIARYPWTVKISSGRARLIKGANGSCSFDSKSCEGVKEAFINIKDEDMFKLLSKSVHYISVWENAMCLRQVVNGVNAVTQARRENISTRGGN